MLPPVADFGKNQFADPPAMNFLRTLLVILVAGIATPPAYADQDLRLVQQSQVCPADCSGNGVCVGTRCQCHPGWQGPACAQSRGVVPPARGCVNDCTGRGECRENRCLCYPGWTGADCRQKVQGALPCENGCFADRGWGFCSNGQCVCAEGRGGEDCGIDLDAGDAPASVLDGNCPGGCGVNGVCLENECLCKDGWTGRNCRSPLAPAAPAGAR